MEHPRHERVDVLATGGHEPMTPTRLLDCIPIVVVTCIWGFGTGRAAALFVRGVNVVAVDRARTVVEGLADLLAFGCFALWGYEVIAFAWPLPHQLAPGALGTVLFEHPVARVVGAVTMLGGFLLWLAAMRAMGSSWRIGIDRDTPGMLVTQGIFARTRNPIYAGFILLMIGGCLMQGRLILLLLASIVIPLLHLQVRREERFLARAHGEAYRAYCARVGRYVTLGRASRLARPRC
jgi:protein-S-isoprenylcysteine O-methyltransferase Ste14